MISSFKRLAYLKTLPDICIIVQVGPIVHKVDYKKIQQLIQSQVA